MGIRYRMQTPSRPTTTRVLEQLVMKNGAGIAPMNGLKRKEGMTNSMDKKGLTRFTVEKAMTQSAVVTVMIC